LLHQIIPRAIDYFTGKALEYDDQMEELDDDEFDDEDFDEEVSESDWRDAIQENLC
jgi:nucleosome assembly protein 1-like 1